MYAAALTWTCSLSEHYNRGGDGNAEEETTL
jgi:hypothetical protein